MRSNILLCELPDAFFKLKEAPDHASMFQMTSTKSSVVKNVRDFGYQLTIDYGIILHIHIAPIYVQSDGVNTKKSSSNTCSAVSSRRRLRPPPVPSSITAVDVDIRLLAKNCSNNRIYHTPGIRRARS